MHVRSMCLKSNEAIEVHLVKNWLLHHTGVSLKAHEGCLHVAKALQTNLWHCTLLRHCREGSFTDKGNKEILIFVKWKKGLGIQRKKGGMDGKDTIRSFFMSLPQVWFFSLHLCVHNFFCYFYFIFYENRLMLILLMVQEWGRTLSKCIGNKFVININSIGARHSSSIVKR